MRFVPLIIIALMLAPTGAVATWRAYGTAEPDSVYDSSDFMWFDAPKPGEKKIYFNAFQEASYVLVNPNLAALGGHVRAEPHQMYNAILGVWVDCNGDGYVGLAESAASDYRAELLTTLGAENRCPVIKQEPTHNDGVWVTELIPIGPDYEGTGKTMNKRVIYDSEALVWGDHGRPFPRVADDAQPYYVNQCQADVVYPMLADVTVPDVDPANPSLPAVEVPGVPQPPSELPESCSPEGIAESARLLLRNNEETVFGIKTESDIRMTFEHGARSRDGRGLLGAATPQDFGVTPLGGGALATFGIAGSALWYDPGGYLYADTNGVVDEDGNPQDALFYTFYARVGQAARAAGQLPSATVGTYGNSFCPTFGAGSGQHHGWECDGALWYEGAPQAEDDFISRGYPGNTYHLRDVDCYDGKVARSVPVGVGTRWLSDTPCLSP